MNVRAKTCASLMVTYLRRCLPRNLSLQLMLVTAVCLTLSILGYGYHIALEQTTDAKRTIKAQMEALAHNLATVNSYFLETGEPEQIETLILQTAIVPGIFSILVTDTSGKPLYEAVSNNNAWSPRFYTTAVKVPSLIGPVSVFEFTPANAAKRDFLAGNEGTMSAWHMIQGKHPLGWVQVSYRLDAFEVIGTEIRSKALKVIALAILITLGFLMLLLRQPMRTLRDATEFASGLDKSQGEQLTVSHGASEIEALGNALNVVSQRLEAQLIDIRNQQFAIDQHAIVSITDLHGVITYANQRFCDISGYSHAELIGQNHRIVKSNEHPAAVFEDLWQTITQGEVWHGDMKNRKKDGSHYWVSATIVPLMGIDGLPRQYIGIRTDISAIKDLEQSYLIAKEQAEMATLAKGQFLANMSHEIRTPMNAILGMLKLLQNTDLNTRQSDYAIKAEGAAQSLLGLLNDILDFSKIDAGKMTLEVRSFRLDNLLRDLSVIISANVGIKPVEVLFDIDAKTPKTLKGDALRLQQVLINLCGNAIKFTAHGEVVVSIKVMAQADQCVTLLIAVRDTGIGISPENQRHIFDGFSQAEASTTRRFGGTGLGLSISRRLVALMGGELSLQSTPGQGSTFSFTVTMPVALDIPNKDRYGTPSLPAAKLSVLVVDDNSTAREVMAAMTRSLGWQVDVAADGPQALTMVSERAAKMQEPYKAIFIDWQMPGMDGWETIAQLNDIQDEEHPPIAVMVSAHGREMLTQRSEQEQARLHGFLVKPVTASMLYDAVADALASRTQPQAFTPSPDTQALPLKGLRLLVVEDNFVNQQVAQEMLSSEGALVQLADNGQIGVDAVHKANLTGTPFDAVLMDIQMPVMDGYAATRVLRQDMALRDLPIIAMTANAMASDREACLAAGMNAHVGKPFSLKLLVELLLKLTRGTVTNTTVEQADKASAATATIAATAKAQAARPLPPVDAVDLAGALDRLGGNQALYVRVLQSYLLDIATLPDQFDVCMSGNDLATAARLLHTAKGLSATVGASYLTAVTQQTELAIKAAIAPVDANEARAWSSSLRNAVANTRTVMREIAENCCQSGSGSTPVPPAVVMPASALTKLDSLHKLSNLLKASDMHALTVHEQIKLSHNEPESVDFKRLNLAMEAFDFSRAAQICDKLIQQSTHG